MIAPLTPRMRVYKISTVFQLESDVLTFAKTIINLCACQFDNYTRCMGQDDSVTGGPPGAVVDAGEAGRPLFCDPMRRLPPLSGP